MAGVTAAVGLGVVTLSNPVIVCDWGDGNQFRVLIWKAADVSIYTSTASQSSVTRTSAVDPFYGFRGLVAALLVGSNCGSTTAALNIGIDTLSSSKN